jgi:aspartyl aminopeptidase
MQKAQQTAQELLDFIDSSPSPWHAVQQIAQRLELAGYQALAETEAWQLQASGKYYVTRAGSSIIAFIVGEQALAQSGLRIIGAHTDSPSLRLKPKPTLANGDILRLGVEVYGGPILASFTDRDLSLAGRINYKTSTGFDTKLIDFARPLLRLANLAIHMNRDVNEQGLKLHKQNELPLLLGQIEQDLNAEQSFLQTLANAAELAADDILNWEINVYDTQKGVLWGAHQEFIADSQLDNLASCHAALSALLASTQPKSTCVCALFDHEEVGSESAAGASGSFLSDVIERISASLALDKQAHLQALARSFFISADMAHAYHPNFPNAYEPCHHVLVNHGPVIKHNVNQRYSSNASTAARFIQLCAQAGVPYQQYAHRTDLGCGSTIGPIVAARLGIASVDVGNPMWAMHSVRESAGVLDHSYMIDVLTAAFAN